jgi:predicted nicotinamide N-methyase
MLAFAKGLLCIRQRAPEQDEQELHDDPPAESFAFADPRLGAPLELRQFMVNDRDASGLWVWAAGTALVRWLVTDEGVQLLRPARAPHKKTVAIELGGGTGLCSLVLVRLGVSHALTTDLDVDALRHCAANVAANSLADCVHTHELPWGDDAAAARVLSALHECDDDDTAPRLLIVGSDILYDRGHFDDLEQTIVSLARGHRARGGAVDVLLAWTDRSCSEVFFLKQCAGALGGEAAVVWSGRVPSRELLGETDAGMLCQIGLIRLEAGGSLP